MLCNADPLQGGLIDVERVMAGGEMLVAVVDERRLQLPADVRRVAAAGGEAAGAPGGDRGGGKRQPLGGLIGLGTSPSSTIRSRFAARSGSGIGTAESSASVYGMIGLVESPAAGESSTILPRYITAIRSLTWRTTPRSCAMKM